jgi:hypothetical protein
MMPLTPETESKKLFTKYFTKLGTVKLFSNIRGRFYTSLKNPRIVSAGCGPQGASDYLGWTEVTVTPDMVGKKIAIFTAAEIKRFDAPNKVRATVEQIDFISLVNKCGGRAAIIDSMDDAKKLLEG